VIVFYNPLSANVVHARRRLQRM